MNLSLIETVIAEHERSLAKVTSDRERDLIERGLARLRRHRADLIDHHEKDQSHDGH